MSLVRSNRYGTFASCAILAVVMMLAQGCATPGAVSSGPVEKGTAGARSDRLNVTVETQSKGDEAGVAAGEIAEAAQRTLMASGFKMDRSSPDIRVGTEVEVELFDQSGNYYVFEGRARSRVERAYDASLIGEDTVSARGERKLGKDEAARAVGSGLAAKTSKWLATTVSPSAAGLKSVRLTVLRAWRLGSDAKYAKNLIDRVSNIEGVVACRQVSHDYKERKMVFRVVYVEDLVPEGPLNRLVNDPELNLKARR